MKYVKDITRMDGRKPQRPQLHLFVVRFLSLLECGRDFSTTLKKRKITVFRLVFFFFPFSSLDQRVQTDNPFQRYHPL